jgi:E3 ubiquitin-protein ligase HECTD1
MGATSAIPTRPTEFIYEYDFDENGALFYLGSFGKKRLWQNPHVIGQVQAFASSVGAGTVDNFVGRVATNCRTQNEPFSYFGVDLGEGRQLLPTCYTIRNRNSTTHVIMNWHLEGSNDKVNWVILDRRIYLTDAATDPALDEEQKTLKQKGGATTWGVDTDIYREVGFDGYRFFRVIQVGKNSSGSDNLALSGFEIYGKLT